MKKIKTKVTIAALVLIILVCGALVLLIGKDNDARIASPGTGKVEGAQIELFNFTGPNFSTKIPKNLRLKTGNDAVGQALYQYLFTSSDASNGDQLAISAGTLPGGNNVQDIPFVKMRSSRPNEYFIDTAFKSQKATNFIAYKNSTSTELGAYWMSGDRYVGIVASSNTNNLSVMRTYVEACLDQWQWQ